MYFDLVILDVSRFDASTTADQVLHGMDLSDKVAVVTGAGSVGGIGFEVARSLARHGAHVVIGARDVVRGGAAAAEIRKAQRGPIRRVDVLRLDLASFDSVAAFADGFTALFDGSVVKLDILVLCAGVMGLPYTQTSDGFETMFQVLMS